MDSLRELIQARQEEITAWLAPGLDIDMLYPSPESDSYRAVLPEFGLMGEGESEDDALNALMVHLTDMMTIFMHSGEPLPDRSEWLAAHPDRPTGHGNE